jgi:hypothetical protein
MTDEQNTNQPTIELVDLIEAALNDVQAVSPYRLAKIASELVGYEVIPQVIYSYVRQGFIKASTNQLGKKQVSHDEAVRWLNKYVARNINKK